MTGCVRLGLNVDHVATLRNARGGTAPDPVRAAQLVVGKGVDGVTAHLREDRRHITDRDLERLRHEVPLPLNMEMAATDEMVTIARAMTPHACCLVPENRAERTTEGGLDVAAGHNQLVPHIATLRGIGIRVSLFVEPDLKQVEAAHRVRADIVELHTGSFCDAVRAGEAADRELARLQQAAAAAAQLGLEVHAGHGIDYTSVTAIAAIPEIAELNIGHFLIGEAVFSGLVASVGHMRALMDAARADEGRA